MKMNNTTLLRMLRNLVESDSRGGFPLIAKHIGCETPSLIAFYHGSIESLTPEERDALNELLSDYYFPRRNNQSKTVTGIYADRDGNFKWTSGYIEP